MASQPMNPTVGTKVWGLIEGARALAHGERATRIQTLVLSGGFKDFWKFWGRLSDFMHLANVSHYWESLPRIAVWTKHIDYLDVFARKSPRFIEAATEAWEQKTLTRRLVNHTIDLSGGVVRLAERWLPKTSVIGRFSLPLAALTALVFGYEDLKKVPDAVDPQIVNASQLMVLGEEYKAKGKDAWRRELMNSGTYSQQFVERLAARLEKISGDIDIDNPFAARILSDLDKERYKKISDCSHSILSGGFLVYASIMGMGPVVAGALLTLMLTSYIAPRVIDRCTW